MRDYCLETTLDSEWTSVGNKMFFDNANKKMLYGTSEKQSQIILLWIFYRFYFLCHFFDNVTRKFRLRGIILVQLRLTWTYYSELKIEKIMIEIRFQWDPESGCGQLTQLLNINVLQVDLSGSSQLTNISYRLSVTSI